MFGINFNKAPSISTEQQEKTEEYTKKLSDLIAFIDTNAKNNRQDSIRYLNERVATFKPDLNSHLKKAFEKGNEEFQAQELELLEFAFNSFADDVKSNMETANSYDDFSNKK